jgi:hypothetical protein
MSRAKKVSERAWESIQERLGKEPDGAIARDLQCPASTVRAHRTRLGIPAYQRISLAQDYSYIDIYHLVSPSVARALIDIVPDSIDDAAGLFAVVQSAGGQKVLKKWGASTYATLPMIKKLSDPEAQGLIAWSRQMQSRMQDRNFVRQELDRFDGRLV